MFLIQRGGVIAHVIMDGLLVNMLTEGLQQQARPLCTGPIGMGDS